MNRISTNPNIGFSPRFKSFTLNLSGELLVVRRPLVMGILNATPDSFYAASRAATVAEIQTRARQLMADGADIIDVGGFSTRPGATVVSEEEEKIRVVMAVDAICKIDRRTIISVDTFSSSVAEAALEKGARIINDISGGRFDSKIIETAAQHNVPYILTHSAGDIEKPTDIVDYSSRGGVTASVIEDLSFSLNKICEAGVNDVIVDPGFGFSKTIEQNFELLRDIPLIAEAVGVPVMVGLSRKSMLHKTLATNVENSLSATVAADTVALLGGASIVRVHDPLPARQTIEIISKTYNCF